MKGPSNCKCTVKNVLEKVYPNERVPQNKQNFVVHWIKLRGLVYLMENKEGAKMANIFINFLNTWVQ